MSRYIDPVPQYFLNNGDIAADGLLDFFENLDYLVRKDTFNWNGDTNPNPVPLDGSGRTPEIQADGLFSVRLRSADGVIQWTRDNVNLSTGASTPDLTSPAVVGDMTFSTSGARIKADLTNTTASSRLNFQTSTMNAISVVGVIPSGSATSSSFASYNSSNPDSASFLAIANGSATTTLLSSRTGAAPFLPLVFHVGGAARVDIDTSGNLAPLADNAYSCGKTSFRFSSFWAANGTIQTSDERTKTEIAESVLGLDFINALEPVSYKFKVGKNVVVPSKVQGGQPTLIPVPGERTHWGLIAQQVKAAADAAGVDFGGHIITDMADPNSQQGLRYDELIAPIVKAVQELSLQNQFLFDRVEALEAIINP